MNTFRDAWVDTMTENQQNRAITVKTQQLLNDKAIKVKLPVNGVPS